MAQDPTNDRSTLVQVIVCQATSLNQVDSGPWCHIVAPGNELTHCGQDKMAAISQRTLSNGFSWIEISLKFVPKGPVNNIPALVQIMAWCRPGDKPLSEPMMVSLATHIWVTRPQWVNTAQGINPCYAEFVLRNAKICLHFLIWDGTGSWSHSSQKTKACLSCILKTEADDDQVKKGGKTSEVVLIIFPAQHRRGWFTLDSVQVRCCQ